jgi:hypothetical protein
LELKTQFSEAPIIACLRAHAWGDANYLLIRSALRQRAVRRAGVFDTPEAKGSDLRGGEPLRGPPASLRSGYVDGHHASASTALKSHHNSCDRDFYPDFPVLGVGRGLLIGALRDN